MGHTIGLTHAIWRRKGLSGSKGDNCRYTGRHASAEWRALSHCRGATVPLEADSNASWDLHCNYWDHVCLPGELMTTRSHKRNALDNRSGQTGWGKAKARLSRVTVGGLRDLGYHVDYEAADQYETRDMNRNCVCSESKIRFLSALLPGDMSPYPRRRRLSAEGLAEATLIGKGLLTNMRDNAGGNGTVYDDDFIGADAISVSYAENGEVYNVLVERDQN